MLYRHLTIPLRRAAQDGGPLLVQGPRGSGKTTLLGAEFPALPYVSLENPADRLAARRDPAAFLRRRRGPAIVDDAHRAPELVAHLGEQPSLDTLVMASSQRLQVPFPTLELHAPTRAERERRAPVSLEMLGRFVPATAPAVSPSSAWPPSHRFLDQDVRELLPVREIDRFAQFVDAARQRSAQVLHQQRLARECGLSHSTVTRWLSVMHQGFLTLLLPPADLAYGRRVVRRPKLHFLDSERFESQVVSEIYRNARHSGDNPDLRYWRDSNGLEVALILQADAALPIPVGIDNAPGVHARVKRWMMLAGVTQGAFISPATLPTRTAGILRYAPNQL